MKTFLYLTLAVLFSCAGLIHTVSADEFVQRDAVKRYLQEISATHDFDLVQLQNQFADLQSQQSILDAISRPAERVLSWRDYRPIFMTEERIEAGKRFLQQQAQLLARAEKRYGVPAAVITAIIGVETYYGRITGKHRVMEALATLAFDFPPRASFFRRELTEFLLLSREENWDALQIHGSYAGAMGMPQFISSSYRQYAIDFDGDGQRDLLDNDADVIGSIANYLSVHGWVRGAPVVERWKPAGEPDEAVSGFISDRLKPSVSSRQLTQLGFASELMEIGMRGDQQASIMSFPLSNTEKDAEKNAEKNASGDLWVGYQNFYTITRYNHSRFYAMVVYQLAQAIERSSS